MDGERRCALIEMGGLFVSSRSTRAQGRDHWIFDEDGNERSSGSFLAGARPVVFGGQIERRLRYGAAAARSFFENGGASLVAVRST